MWQLAPFFVKRFLIPLLAALALPTVVNGAELNIYIDDFTNEKEISVSEKSENTLVLESSSGWNKKQYRNGYLIGQCRKNQIVFSLETGVEVSNYEQRIDIKFDDSEIYWARVNGRQNNSLLILETYYPTQFKTKEFIEKILQHEKLSIRFVDISDYYAVLKFDLEDLKTKLKEAEKEGCKLY